MRTTVLNYFETTKKHGGDTDQEDRKHESRQGELPTEPRMGQAFIY